MLSVQFIGAKNPQHLSNWILVMIWNATTSFLALYSDSHTILKPVVLGWDRYCWQSSIEYVVGTCKRQSACKSALNGDTVYATSLRPKDMSAADIDIS